MEQDHYYRDIHRAKTDLMMPTDGPVVGLLAAALLAILCFGMSHELIAPSDWSKRNEANMHRWIQAELKAPQGDSRR